MNLRELSFIEFDNFAQKHILNSFYQSSSYALLMTESGYEYDYVGLLDEQNNLVAASLILLKKIKGKIKYGYAPKGFLLDYNNEKLVKIFTAELLTFYQNKNVAFIKLNPEIIIGEIDLKTKKTNYNENKNIYYTLEQNHYLKLKNNFYFESTLPRFNAVLSLKDYEFKKLTKNTKNKINKSIRKGLIFEPSNIKGIDIFNKLTKDIKNDFYYKDLYNVFSKSCSIDLFLVKIDYEEFLINTRIAYDLEIEKNNYYNENLRKNSSEDNVNVKMASDLVLLAYKNDILEGTKGLKDNKESYIAGALTIKYNDTVYLIASEYDKIFARYNANYFLHYKIIEYYKNDFSYLDLGGLTGDLTKNNPYYGLNNFKLGFKPKFYEYIGEFDLIIDSDSYSYLKQSGILAKEFNKKTV